MKHMLVALGVLGFVCGATPVQAQEDLERLDVWVGDWTWVDMVKDSPSGDASKVEGTGQFRRMGDFFYVWRGEWKDADGEEMSRLNINGYDPVKKAYVAYGFASDGSRGTATVTFNDKTVTHDWTEVSATGEKTRRRCTDKLPEAGPYSWSCEDFTDGKWWASIKGKGSVTK